MICVHHTTGYRDKLEKKLLQDSSKIKSKSKLLNLNRDGFLLIIKYISLFIYSPFMFVKVPH
jgi:hypothetical protein